MTHERNKMGIRVLYIDHTIFKSGAAISLGTLIRYLPHDVEPHFVLRTGSDVEETIGAEGKPVYRERWMPQFMTTLRTEQYGPVLYLWHLLKIPMALVHTYRLVKRWGIDIIHLNETALIPYAYVARLLGVAVVMHARGATAPRPIEQFFLRLMGSFSKTAIIAIDEETVWSLPDKSKSITDIVYNPIDISQNLAAVDIRRMRASWGCGDDDVVIGQVAALHSTKGIWEIVELAATLSQKYPHVKFILVGDDRAEAGEGPRIREVLNERGLAKHVTLPGYLESISLVYASLDIALCFFSDYLGGVGRGAFEAAIAGKVDKLLGLKENVMIGRLIPTGSRAKVVVKKGKSEKQEEEKE